jgi:hypothetical protein
MEKTIRQWFETIADPQIREAAIYNAETCDRNTINSTPNSLSDAIQAGFLWHETFEGTSYWDLVSRLAAQGKLETIEP